MTAKLPRRRLLGLAGAGAAGLVGAGAVGALVRDSAAKDPAGPAASSAVDFYGGHQAGITTAAQDRLHFVAFDVISRKRGDVIALLRAWTAAGARMTLGHDAGEIGAVNGNPQAPPDDTGEA